MFDGYEAFGKNHVDTQSGRTSLETMRKISRMIDGLITVDEEAMQCIPALSVVMLPGLVCRACSLRSCDLLLPPSLRPFMLPGFIATMRQSDF